MNMYFYLYFNNSPDVVTSLLTFVDIYHFNYTFSHTHILAHTRKCTSINLGSEIDGRLFISHAHIGDTRMSLDMQ